MNAGVPPSTQVIIGYNRYRHYNRNSQSAESCDSCCVPVRYLVVVLGMLGCTVDYLLRFSISVAIVAMVNNTKSSHDHNSWAPTACPAANVSHTVHTSPGAGQYSWSVRQQSVILGIFFWGYVMTKTVGGRIAEVIGARTTMGVSLGVCGLLSLLSPTAADLHPMVLAAVRFLMGILQGPSFPALYSVLASWSPPHKRATMSAIAASGSYLGMVLAFGCSGWVVEYYGWRWVFWDFGMLAVAWTILWMVCVRDTPAQHPFISAREETQLAQVDAKPRRRVPWRRVFRCRTLYLCLLSEFSASWVLTFTTTEGPTFLTYQVGMSLKQSSEALVGVSGFSFVICQAYGWLSDLLLRRKLLTKTNIRRLIACIGVVVVVAGGVTVAVRGCDPVLVACMMALMQAGVSNAGSTYNLTPMDLAPNYAGTLVGLVGLGAVGGFLGPLANDCFLSLHHGWEAIIAVSCVLFFLSGVLYVVGVTSEEQEWNQYEEIDGDQK